MAIAGGATTAYSVWLDDERKLQVGASRMVGRRQCTNVDDALFLLRTSDTVTVLVAGSDLAALRRALGK